MHSEVSRGVVRHSAESHDVDLHEAFVPMASKVFHEDRFVRMNVMARGSFEPPKEATAPTATPSRRTYRSGALAALSR